ncbi:MAG: hypothetical protein KJ956_00010 [Actinobacteria bacterium]|nr:hypothetical protein [Actinomycetota bacterium]
MRSAGDTRPLRASCGIVPGAAVPMLGALLAATLLLSGCSTGSSPSETISPTAAEVLAGVEAALGEQEPLDPGEVVVPEGCRLVVETDEYDFETEVVVCDEEPATTDPGSTATTTTALPQPAPLEGWGGSADARAVARRLRDAVVEQTGCESPQDLITLESLTETVPAEVAASFSAAVEDLRRSAELCNIDVAGWQAALESALDHLEEMTAILLESADG